MFLPPSIDETHPNLPLLTTDKESTSRMPPKTTNLAGTRLPPPPLPPSHAVPPSPSLSSIDAAIAGRPRLSASEADGADPGSETPRVNGYAFVEEDDSEDERDRERAREKENAASQPTYRDLLAGQVEAGGGGGDNPFSVQEKGGREKLHHRLVRRALENQKMMTAGKDTAKGDGPRFWSSPVIPRGGAQLAQGREKGKGNIGNLTPAGRRLLERVGRTPMSTSIGRHGGDGDMWTPTPGRTPRTPRKG